jgi:hypothetical protein
MSVWKYEGLSGLSNNQVILVCFKNIEEISVPGEAVYLYLPDNCSRSLPACFSVIQVAVIFLSVMPMNTKS